MIGILNTYVLFSVLEKDVDNIFCNFTALKVSASVVRVINA
jgi:hypothetical protein